MRWDRGGEATDPSRNTANSGFLKRKILLQWRWPSCKQVARRGHDMFILGDAQNGLGKPLGSLLPLRLFWAGGWAGDPTEPLPTLTNLQTVMVQPNHLLLSLAKRAQETLVFNCLSYFSLPAAATWPRGSGVFLTENRIPWFVVSLSPCTLQYAIALSKQIRIKEPGVSAFLYQTFCSSSHLNK